MMKRDGKCFDCGENAVHVYEIPLTQPHFGAWVDWVKRGTGEERSPITVTIFVCASHQPHVQDYILEYRGIAPGYGLKGRTCAHPFHSGGDGTANVESVGGWTVESYGCPRCDFRSFHQDVYRHDAEHPTYIALEEIFGWAAKRVEGAPE